MLSDKITIIGGNGRGTIAANGLQSDRAFNLPDAAGTLALVSDIPTDAPYSKVVSVGASRTLALADLSKFLLCSSSSAIKLTIPTDAIAFPVGSEITITQDGEGTVTVDKTATVTLSGDGRANPDGGFTLLYRFASVFLKKVASNSWRIYGALQW